MRPRGGASLLEVLFAILITAIGLFGAIAVFPVASSYAKRGRNADMQSNGAHTAYHKLDAIGGRRVEDNWCGYNPQTGAREFVVPKVVNTTQTAQGRLSRFVNGRLGMSFCIDPRFLSRNVGSVTTIATARKFPYSAPDMYPAQQNQIQPMMERITLRNFPGSTVTVSGVTVPVPMGRLQADSVFGVEDDLAFVRPGDEDVSGIPNLGNDPDDRTLGAWQTWFYDVGGNPVRRETSGEFSWLATLVPKVDIHSLANISTNDLYVLSLVMFYQRPIADLAEDTIGSPVRDYSERYLNVDVSVGDGVGGGTFRLLAPNTAPYALTAADTDAAKEWLKVKPGDWILLGGNTSMTNTFTMPNRPIPIFKWYRVSDCDNEPLWNTTDNRWELYVSLVGQDWDTSLTLPRAIVLDGVIGVYEKTIRLEYGSSM